MFILVNAYQTVMKTDVKKPTFGIVFSLLSEWGTEKLSNVVMKHKSC